MLRAFQMTMRAGALPGDPAARSVAHRNAAVERGRKLERDKSTALGLPRPPGRHRGARLGRQHVGDDLDPRRPQSRDALTIGARIGILRGDDDARDACGNQRVGTAGAARTGVRARFECYISGGAARRITRGRQRHRLGMGSAAGLRPAAPDDLPTLDDQAADIGIGRRRRPSAPRQRDGGRHPVGIGGGALHALSRQLAIAARAPRARRGSSAGRPPAFSASPPPRLLRPAFRGSPSSASAESYSTPIMSASR